MVNLSDVSWIFHPNRINERKFLCRKNCSLDSVVEQNVLTHLTWLCVTNSSIRPKSNHVNLCTFKTNLLASQKDGVNLSVSGAAVLSHLVVLCKSIPGSMVEPDGQYLATPDNDGAQVV